MVMTTTMTLAEVIALSLGWVVAIVAVILHILIWKFTHAWTFLRAWFQKVPIVREIDGGMVTYIKGKSHDEGTIDLPHGFVIKTHNSHVFDKKSKVPLYDKYSDYAFTLDSEYNAIVSELRAMGISSNNYDELRSMIQLATNDEYAAEFLGSIQDETQKAEVRARIEKLKQLEIKIKPYKSYKLQDLSNMFPNNINTVLNEHKVIAIVDRNAKKYKFNSQLIMYIAFGCVIIVFALVMLSKFVKDPSCPDVVCNCAKAGMEVIKSGIEAAATEPESASEAAKNILIP